MSEHSESLHFWRTSREQVRHLVVSQNVAGRIVALNDRWLCFVALDAADQQNIVAHAEGPLLKWSYYDDYALSVEFFRTSRLVGQASFVWGTGLTGQPSSASLPAQLVTALSGLGFAEESLDELKRIALDVELNKARGIAIRDRVARALGLAAYEWLSPETCLEIPLEEFQEGYPDAEDIATAEG